MWNHESKSIYLITIYNLQFNYNNILLQFAVEWTIILLYYTLFPFNSNCFASRERRSSWTEVRCSDGKDGIWMEAEVLDLGFHHCTRGMARDTGRLMDCAGAGCTRDCGPLHEPLQISGKESVVRFNFFKLIGWKSLLGMKIKTHHQEDLSHGRQSKFFDWFPMGTLYPQLPGDAYSYFL